MNKEELKKIRQRMYFYQNHEFGAERWLEDHVCIAIQDFKTGALKWTLLGELPDTVHPETGRTYKEMWEWQKENVIRPATSRDENGFYNYHTVAICMPRGEGKSYIMNLLVVYRFFTQPRQKIILGANSKDQTKFVSFEIIQELIRNSPKLISILGQENIREKEVRLKDAAGNTASYIRSVSSFTGIFSNITAFVFSELFDMTNPKFYYQLDSSRRNIPNAQGYIDSTVSSRSHVLYTLYEASPLKHNTDPGILFVYRFSSDAHVDDYLHPCMTQKQLNSFKVKFTPTEFARYFKNKWSLEDTALYNPATIRSLRYIGHQGQLGKQQSIIHTCKQIIELEDDEDLNKYQSNKSIIETLKLDIDPIPYSLTEDGLPRWATNQELDKLGDIYDTDWAIGAGIDRADPLKDDITLGARTIMTFMAKGLPGSRSNPDMHIDNEDKVKYIYFLIHLANIETHELADIQYEMEKIRMEYGVIKTLCGERWGLQEIPPYCEEHDIQLELISPTYDRQRTAFNAMYNLIRTGYFKSPEVLVATHKSDNILDQELTGFRHEAVKKWYGSLEKNKPTGIQDDSIFSCGWNIYGMRTITPEDFGFDRSDMFFGEMLNNNTSLIGKY